MNKINPFIILLFLGVVASTSCKKKDKVNNCDLTEANFVGSYKIESVTYKMSPSSPDVDGTSLIFDPCELDDVTTFNTNHTYTYADAGTQCNPPADDNGTWSLSGSTFTFDGVQQDFDTFDCTGFSISDTAYDVSGDKITVKFKKQ
ncbi:MAG: lipocalin family protein [Ginsengibacter sp.]